MIRREVHLPRTWDTAPRSRWPSRDIYEEAHLEVERILAEGTVNQLEPELQEKLDSIYQELYRRVNSKPIHV
jgi:hypothetical protein